MKEKLKPIFVPYGIDGRPAYTLAKNQGYKYAVVLERNKNGKDAAWLVANENDLLKTCLKLNRKTYYKIFTMNSDIELPALHLN